MLKRAGKRHYTAASDNIVAYQWKADIYSPEEIIEAMMMNAGVSISLWPRLKGLSAEEALDIIAADMGIDRMDEYSFDSDDFPKVVFADHFQEGEYPGLEIDASRTAHRRTASVVDESYIRRFIGAYVEAELWTALLYGYGEGGVWYGEGEDPINADSVDAEVSAKSMQDIERVCREFVMANESDLTALQEQFPQAGPEQCGHDFSLTRNGHGAGFWDRGYGPLGDKLTQACRPYGETNWDLIDGELVTDSQ
jgi:hypothetical protein